MTRKSTTIAALALWAVALLAVAGLLASRRPAPDQEPTPGPVPDALREALLGVRRVVVVEGPPDDDPRGVSRWDAGLTASAASAIVDDLRLQGFKRAVGSKEPAPGVVSRVRTLGPKGRDPASSVVAALHADALVFVAVRSLRVDFEDANTLTCQYDGKGWVRLLGPGSGRSIAWDRSGRLRETRDSKGRDPVFEPKRAGIELARRWGRGLIGPDLAARLARPEALALSRSGDATRTDTTGATP